MLAIASDSAFNRRMSETQPYAEYSDHAMLLLEQQTHLQLIGAHPWSDDPKKFMGHQALAKSAAHEKLSGMGPEALTAAKEAALDRAIANCEPTQD
jgi:hypothetical protein